MPHLPPRAGCALVLLGTALGPVAGPRDASTPISTVAQATATEPTAADSSSPQVLLIPCVSGMCQVPLQGTPALTPFTPGPRAPLSSTSAAPYALADR